MRRRERVVAIDVAKAGQKGRHFRIVGFLHRGKPGVFDQNHRIHRQGVDLVAAGPFDERHRAAQRLFQRGQGDAQAHLGHDLPLGAAKMGQHDRRAALGQYIADRRHDAVDSGRVGDAAAFDRDVDIDADQHPFAAKVHVIEGFPGHRRLRFAVIG